MVNSAKEGEKWCLGCENEGLKKGIYRREGGKGSAIMGGFGRESGLNLKGEVGGDL